jgi:predicted 3-demethylubiquinone-9 3-methyltransferase (glyoxalase superfamily)
MQKITPFLWFEGNAEAAMNFYVSIFKNSQGRARVALWRRGAWAERIGHVPRVVSSGGRAAANPL